MAPAASPRARLLLQAAIIDIADHDRTSSDVVAEPGSELEGLATTERRVNRLKYASRISADAPCVAKVMRGGAIITPDLLKLNSTDICMPSRAASAAGGDQQERRAANKSPMVLRS